MIIKGSKNIIHSGNPNAVTVTVADDSTGIVVVNGRSVLPAGTLIAGVTNSYFEDNSQNVKKVVTVATDNIDGVLFYDVDVTDGQAVGAMVHKGNVLSNAVDGFTEDVRAKLPRIQFVNAL